MVVIQLRISEENSLFVFEILKREDATATEIEIAKEIEGLVAIGLKPLADSFEEIHGAEG